MFSPLCPNCAQYYCEADDKSRTCEGPEKKPGERRWPLLSRWEYKTDDQLAITSLQSACQSAVLWSLTDVGQVKLLPIPPALQLKLKSQWDLNDRTNSEARKREMKERREGEDVIYRVLIMQEEEEDRGYIGSSIAPADPTPAPVTRRQIMPDPCPDCVWYCSRARGTSSTDRTGTCQGPEKKPGERRWPLLSLSQYKTVDQLAITSLQSACLTTIIWSLTDAGQMQMLPIPTNLYLKLKSQWHWNHRVHGDARKKEMAKHRESEAVLREVSHNEEAEEGRPCWASITN